MATRINRIALVLLLGASAILVADARRTTQPRPLSDRTLALVFGSNGKQTGSVSYTCADAAAATNAKFITAENCGKLTNAQANNKTCVSCNVLNSSVINGQQGNPLTYLNATANCAKDGNGNKSQLNYVGTCQPNMANPNASCQGPTTPNVGICPAGNYALYKQQNVM